MLLAERENVQIPVNCSPFPIFLLSSQGGEKIKYFIINVKKGNKRKIEKYIYAFKRTLKVYP